MDWVLVHWLDINSFEAPWATKEEALDLAPAQMWSTGIILKETPDYLIISGTVDPSGDGSYGNVNASPKGCIKSIRVLREQGHHESPDTHLDTP